MANPSSLLTWLHVSANIVWIGAILAVGAVLTAPSGEQKTRGELARTVYLRLAVPAFVISFVCGVAQLSMNTSYYLVEHHWMHGKLLAAVAVIGLHHVLGARAKRAAGGEARGTVQEARSTAMLTAILAVMAVIAAFFAVVRLPS